MLYVPFVLHVIQFFYSGNSGGGHADYWDLFWSNRYPRIQGEREKKVWEEEKEGEREERMRGKERGRKRKTEGEREKKGWEVKKESEREIGRR